MEAGQRALGARSILADPRSVETRDRVNAAIKYREYWRPFCPSMTLEDAGRYVLRPAPAPFMQGLREICEAHGILLIADEIQSGMGRTGTWWAIEHAGVEPDIVTTAKGIASGMPIGAFIARESVWTWPPGAHGSTFAGNPVCAAAGLATLDVIEREGLSNATAMGARLRAGIERAAAEAGTVRDVRGAGLMLGVEFASHGAAEAVQDAAFERGLLTLECGESSLRFSPPLIVTESDVDTAIRIFAEALPAATRPEKGIAEVGG
jgi:4-aminobutyrate aminotransferase